MNDSNSIGIQPQLLRPVPLNTSLEIPTSNRGSTSKIAAFVSEKFLLAPDSTSSEKTGCKEKKTHLSRGSSECALLLDSCSTRCSRSSRGDKKKVFFFIHLALCLSVLRAVDRQTGMCGRADAQSDSRSFLHALCPDRRRLQVSLACEPGERKAERICKQALKERAYGH